MSYRALLHRRSRQARFAAMWATAGSRTIRWRPSAAPAWSRFRACRNLLRFICEHGFEHHAAANFSPIVAASCHEATTKYLGWDMYWHKEHEHGRRGSDFGTLNVRVSIFDSEKGRLGAGSREYPLHRKKDDPDHATQSHADHMRPGRSAMTQSACSRRESTAVAIASASRSTPPARVSFRSMTT